jgi:cytochrome c
MRKPVRTLGVAALAAMAAIFAGAALYADDDDGGDDAEAKKLEADALSKAVARGNELFRSKEGVKKTCASCHENPEKPQFNLATRSYSYPRYSRKAKGVVSLGMKINEMLTNKSGATKELDLKGADIVAIEAYVASLKK